MNELGGGLGTAEEGSLLARALEPGSGARDPHPHQPANCLNCRTALVGAYCHACGQQAHLHRTLGGFMHDLLHGALHFEGKIWRTLPMLVLRPGTLTRRYIEGARARFVSPLALFLFSVFLMFAVFQALGITPPADLALDTNVVENIDAARRAAEAEASDARGGLRALPADHPGRPAALLRLEEAERDVAELARTNPLLAEADGEQTSVPGNTGIKWVDENLVRKWRQDPELMLYKLQTNSYKFSWLLIPLSLPFVWILFAWKRQFKGYDHTIFVTYSLSFMSFLFVTFTLLSAAGVPGDVLGPGALVIAPIHLYKQLKDAYSLRRRSALWRLVALYVMILIIMMLFLQILLVLGAF